MFSRAIFDVDRVARICAALTTWTEWSSICMIASRTSFAPSTWLDIRQAVWAIWKKHTFPLRRSPVGTSHFNQLSCVFEKDVSLFFHRFWISMMRRVEQCAQRIIIRDATGVLVDVRRGDLKLKRFERFIKRSTIITDESSWIEDEGERCSLLSIGLGSRFPVGADR